MKKLVIIALMAFAVTASASTVDVGWDPWPDAVSTVDVGWDPWPDAVSTVDAGWDPWPDAR